MWSISYFIFTFQRLKTKLDYAAAYCPQQKGLLMQLVMELAGEVDGGTSSCMEAVLLEESKTIHSL